jgi:hypothetical protein
LELKAIDGKKLNTVGQIYNTTKNEVLKEDTDKKNIRKIAIGLIAAIIKSEEINKIKETKVELTTLDTVEVLIAVI